MLDAERRQEFVDRLAPAFAGLPWVVAAYLFGSHAQGCPRPWSDVDVGIVLADDGPGSEERILPLAYLEARLAAALHGAPVDVVILNGQGPVFQHTVLRTGFPLYERDRSARALFEARVISEYCDFLPTLRWFQRFHDEGVRRRLDEIEARRRSRQAGPDHRQPEQAGPASARDL